MAKTESKAYSKNGSRGKTPQELAPVADALEIPIVLVQIGMLCKEMIEDHPGNPEASLKKIEVIKNLVASSIQVIRREGRQSIWIKDRYLDLMVKVLGAYAPESWTAEELAAAGELMELLRFCQIERSSEHGA